MNTDANPVEPSDTFLDNHNPIIIRVDGHAFRTFTRGFRKPFDTTVTAAMVAATKYLCANVGNCRLGYTHSDEISLLLVPYGSPRNEKWWFNNRTLKISSIAASMATMAFNNAFRELTEAAVATGELPADCVQVRRGPTAVFDARAFNLRVNAVNDYFASRQDDCARNSISAYARTKFSQKQMNGNNSYVQRMRLLDVGVDWEAEPSWARLGHVVIKETYTLDNEQRTVRHRWMTLSETPRFRPECFVDRFTMVGEHDRGL